MIAEVICIVLVAAGAAAAGYWLGYDHGRKRPLIVVPPYEYATLLVSDGCEVNEGAVFVQKDGDFTLHVEENDGLTQAARKKLKGTP